MYSTSPIPDGNLYDVAYIEYLQRLQMRFTANLSQPNTQLFRTYGDPDLLWDAYLGSFPASDRQYHNCNACRAFIRNYGDLVTIGADGYTKSALWYLSDCTADIYPAVKAMRDMVEDMRVSGPFYATKRVLGTPVTGVWRHFAVTPPPAILHTSKLQTPFQRTAEQREDYNNVHRALESYPLALLETAMRVLDANVLYRTEKVLGPAKWLRDLQAQVRGKRGFIRDNLIWRAVVAAPAGFCHPRSSMIGTLLDDLTAGLDFDTVASRFAAKMNPLRYQRPQAAPAAGAIQEAERIFETLGLAPSLERRYATLDDLRPFWTPPAPVAQTSGIFQHLMPKPTARTSTLQLPPQTMTFCKFRQEVLPTAKSIQFYVPSHHQGFIALVTATHPDAPPLLQWDRPNARNPVSWFYKNGGLYARDLHLAAYTWVDVSMLCYLPCHWDAIRPLPHYSNTLIAILQGAVPPAANGLGLFPECLRYELHKVRSVIEAHSASSSVSDAHGTPAAGIAFSANKPWDEARFRVDGTEYTLDRWD